ncbi:MAG: 30S ribosomal protein S8 [Parcubacteria group bacterium GW2011_GWA2_42_35]|nr:MAG: 30S ribosomal protein S8 [Parcubacteria group bacterium GW2011_GWA2_42_35]
MDPVADMLTKIRNAQAVGKETVVIPYSKLKAEVAKALIRFGYLKEARRRGRKNKKILELELLYKNNTPKISGLKKISKPSCRVYQSAKNLKSVRGGRGMAVISTTKGILSDREAKKENLGGEIICEIW